MKFLQWTAFKADKPSLEVTNEKSACLKDGHRVEFPFFDIAINQFQSTVCEFLGNFQFVVAFWMSQ